MSELIQRCEEVMESNKELLLLRGKMYGVEICYTKDKKAKYYTFKLKVLKNLGNNDYGHCYNTYHCVVPVVIAGQYNDTDFESMKDNEVICICTANAQVRKSTNSDICYNNITLFVNTVKVVKKLTA